MDSNFDIEAVNNLGTLNSFDALFASLKLIAHTDFDSNINLYVFFPGMRQISCYKLFINTSISNSGNYLKENTQNSFRSSILRFQQTLHFPAPLFDLTASNNDVWAIGSKSFLSIRKVLENKSSVQADDCMESDYPFCGFVTLVSSNDFQKHIFQGNFFCFNCDLVENSILICNENSELSSWQVILVINSSAASRHNLEYIQILSFPSSYSRENTSWSSNEEKVGKPEVVFCDSKHPLWKNICDSKTRSFSNYVCLIGNPDGTIVYSLCSWNSQRKEFKQVSSLQKLCKLEEPILCICFRENIGKLLRSNLMIIIGENGKLLLVTSEKLPSNADSSKLINGLWISSWQLPSSVQSFVILDECIIYCSLKGEVWIVKFYANDTQEDIVDQCIKVTTRASDFKNICSLFLINKEEGLFIMVTNTGNMYLMKYSDKKSLVNNRSLPVLMNGILEQSILLKDLVSVKHLQSRLFVALSAFANIKFGAVNKLRLECKMSEVEDSSKKLFITINLDGLQQFNLDTEFWMISASVFNNFQADSAIITKCSPLVLGQTLYLEVSESNFCLSHSSLFPLYLEVGLILRVPKSLMSIDCFRDIVKNLPLFIKTNTAILTELYLLKNKSKVLENSKFKNNTEIINILQEISNNKTRNPLYKRIDYIPETFIPIFNKYTYCLLESTAGELVKNLNKESGLEQSIFQAILEKSSLSPDSDGANLLCQNQPLSLSVLQGEKIVNINITTESLIILGLKTAIAELLLTNQPKSVCEATNCVSIPASILKKCEELSKELRSMYGQDVTGSEFLGTVFKVYCKLRKEISEKLPL